MIKYDPRKNFKNLIAAFRLLRKRMPCKLVVTGIGCEKYREEYELAEDGTSNDVQFLGWVDQENLPALYTLARCMFFPSVYEEFGIPVAEAMACGCPPVVSNTGALPESPATPGSSSIRSTRRSWPTRWNASGPTTRCDRPIRPQPRARKRVHLGSLRARDAGRAERPGVRSQTSSDTPTRRRIEPVSRNIVDILGSYCRGFPGPDRCNPTPTAAAGFRSQLQRSLS